MTNLFGMLSHLKPEASWIGASIYDDVTLTRAFIIKKVYSVI